LTQSGREPSLAGGGNNKTKKREKAKSAARVKKKRTTLFKGGAGSRNIEEAIKKQKTICEGEKMPTPSLGWRVYVFTNPKGPNERRGKMPAKRTPSA